MVRYTTKDKEAIAKYQKQEKWTKPDLMTGEREFIGYKCNGCGDTFPLRNLEVDHIRPLSKHGGLNPSNLQLLCSACNRQKGSKIQKTDKKAKTASRLKKISSVTKAKRSTKKKQ
jgi:5-methylcytosine-specific restriction endonuclease McrA